MKSKKPSTPRPPRLWFQVEDANCCTWRIYIVSPSTCPQLRVGSDDAVDGDDAVTLSEQGLIAISDELSDDRKRLAVFHELMHLPGTHSGAPQTLKNILHCKPEEVNEREEDLVSWMSPPMFALLFRNGMLKFPRIPK